MTIYGRLGVPVRVVAVGVTGGDVWVDTVNEYGYPLRVRLLDLSADGGLVEVRAAICALPAARRYGERRVLERLFPRMSQAEEQ